MYAEIESAAWVYNKAKFVWKMYPVLRDDTFILYRSVELPKLKSFQTYCNITGTISSSQYYGFDEVTLNLRVERSKDWKVIEESMVTLDSHTPGNLFPTDNRSAVQLLYTGTFEVPPDHHITTSSILAVIARYPVVATTTLSLAGRSAWDILRMYFKVSFHSSLVFNIKGEENIKIVRSASFPMLSHRSLASSSSWQSLPELSSGRSSAQLSSVSLNSEEWIAI
ncbi:hypothetical protein 4 [Wenling tombus-like virus 2]|uniref:hypothetical protein 4 n=1 Tax=Wenling tombus-like virus 2 TaxID=1923544 RepID=UPI00090CD35A|nr:hypothetical protein 4 [Wenling tombus-like virus 2]APG76589.1 hypothetical protein 4 [Wenling tombus-like virus 2]